MSDIIQVGDALLDYAGDIYEICEGVCVAYVHAVNACGLLGNEIYEGYARGEVEAYFASLTQHLEKMGTLYQAAHAYLINIYQEFYYTDAQFAEYLAGEMERAV